jgi:queuine tRNA-ribosyltransferase
MPVGTQATVKTLSQEELEQLGFQIILGNTYHLYLRPGDERIARLGGLHRFMRWERAILTDSGGFQVFSLAPLRQIDDDGVTFRSHIDGSEHRLTPERAVQIQRNLGSDIMMAFDECPPYPASRDEVARATERTYRWALRCRAAWQAQPNGQALFGILQGGVYDDLRLMSLQQITELDLPGYAIGGVSVGEPVDEMRRMVELIAPRMPADKPRYLMGVGAPDDILHAVQHGGGHVRLRAADPLGAPPCCVHQHGTHQPTQRAVPRARRAHRPHLRLLGVPAVQPCLHPPSVSCGRDACLSAGDLSQLGVLRALDGADPPAD